MNTNTCQFTVIIASAALVIFFCVVFPYLTWFHQLAVLSGMLGFIFFVFFVFLYFECCVPEKVVKHEIEVNSLPQVVVIIDPDDSVRVGVYKTEETIEND